jgi:hypothetical protein
MAGALTIQRVSKSDIGTIGHARLDDGGWEFDSFERPPRGNQHDSCIPAGLYRAYAHRYPNSDGILAAGLVTEVYELQDVPGRNRVEINLGNWAGDPALGLYCNLLGQIALGVGFKMLRPPGPYEPQLALVKTKEAFDNFMKRTSGYGITVRIIDP